MHTSPSASRRALVLYGSETGNAQDAAEELGRLLRRLHFAITVEELNAANLHDLCKYTVVVIAVSTAGQGDIPRNGNAFWKKLLRKKLAAPVLCDLKYGIFGLGDGSYPHFNYAALKLSKRLAQLGASEILPVGAADAQHAEGNEGALIPWASLLQTRVLDMFPLSNSDAVIPESHLLQPPWLLARTTEASADTAWQMATSKGVSGSVRLDVVVEANRRVTPSDHWQDVRVISLSSQEHVQYSPGDILEIQPQNPDGEVQQFLNLLGWTDVADHEIAFARNPNYLMDLPDTAPRIHPHRPAKEMTLRQILTHCIDINAIPKRSFFRQVLHFTEDEFQRARLEEFASHEFTEELFDYTTRPRRSILEVVQEFDTLRIPWQWLFAIVPPLRPRQFSIASGGKLKVNARGLTRFELLVAIVKYKTVIKKLRKGTCTRYLELLTPGQTLDVALVQGSLGIRAPHAHLPSVMIGPGTGVAPLRALLWEKYSWMGVSPTDSKPTPALSKSGRNVLFFGCRNEAADYFFKEEWEFLASKVPLDVHTAFSRDQREKLYVQDLLLQHKSMIFELIYQRNGLLTVCGSSGKMPAAVRSAVTTILEEGLHCVRAEAEAYLRSMEKDGRYKQETW